MFDRYNVDSDDDLRRVARLRETAINAQLDSQAHKAEPPAQAEKAVGKFN
jgi:hypothetical protein